MCDPALYPLPCPSALQACLLYISAYALFMWVYGAISGIWQYGLHWQAVHGILAAIILPLLLLLLFMTWCACMHVRSMPRTWHASGGSSSSSCTALQAMTTTWLKHIYIYIHIGHLLAKPALSLCRRGRRGREGKGFPELQAPIGCTACAGGAAGTTRDAAWMYGARHAD